MNNVAPKHYYRVIDSSFDDSLTLDASSLTLPANLISKIQPGDGLVLSSWDEDSQLGTVTTLGVVIAVKPDASTAIVKLAPASITLKPNPSGRRWWRNEFFKFAESVKERYMLDDLFAEHFPEYSTLELGKKVKTTGGRARQYQKVAGYIYLLRSEYGYKIGKTVNLKGRTRLFEVKLPFKFDLEFAQFVENYSRVEAQLHHTYSEFRLEGEWFKLDDNHVSEIKATLASIPKKPGSDSN